MTIALGADPVWVGWRNDLAQRNATTATRSPDAAGSSTRLLRTEDGVGTKDPAIRVLGSEPLSREEPARNCDDQLMLWCPMTRPISLFVGSVAFVASVATTSATFYTAPCRSPSTQSDAARFGLHQFLLSSHAGLSQTRTAWGLAGVDTSDVVLFSDASICSRGSEVWDSIHGLPQTGDSVFVFSLGPTRYGLDKGVSTGKEKRGVFIFDTSWVHIGTLAVPNAPW